MIEVECECGRVIKTKDENAGKKAKCPDCGEIIQIPAPRKAGAKPSAAAKKAPAASAVKSKRPKPEDEFDDGEDGSGEDFDDGEEAEAPRSKKGTAKKSSKSADGGEASGKKKKKKKGKENEEELNKKIMIGTAVFFGIAFLGMAGYGIYYAATHMGGGGSAAVEVPKEYEDYSSTNGEVRCKIPKGWDKKSAGGSGGVPASATIEKGNVKIQFKSSNNGASTWMRLNAGGADTSKMPDDEKPISKLHEELRNGFAEGYSGYDEKKTEMWKAGGGEVRVSEFTGSEGFSKVFGYRVTMPGVQSQFTVTCKCSGDQWEKFKPVFKTVVESASSN